MRTLRKLINPLINAGIRPPQSGRVGMSDELTRRIAITNRICVTVTALGLPYILTFALTGARGIALEITASALSYLAVPLLNHYGWYVTSRTFMVVTGNLMTFFVALQVGQAGHTYMYLLALLALPMVLFETSHRLLIGLLTLLPCVLMVTLAATSFLGVEPLALTSGALVGINVMSVVATALSLLAAMGFFLVVTGRAAALAAVEKDKLNSIFRSVEDLVFMLDLQGRYVAVNDRIYRYGATPEQLIGKTIFDLVPPEAAAAYDREHRKALERGEVTTFLRRQEGTDGQILWFQISLTPARDAEGKIMGLVGVSRDVTEDRRRDEELREARDRADAGNTAKTYFLANVSHELRTPITAILGFAELLAQPNQTPARIQSSIATILRNGRILNDLIGDILDVTKIESGKLQLRREPFGLEDVLGNVVTPQRVAAKAKGVALELTIDPDAARQFEGDPPRLGQILTNLIGNAVKFTANGRIDVAARMVVGSGVLEIAVKDSGCGIDPESASTLFRPFTQADATTSRRYGGTGLGLSLSRSLARAMGGDVKLTSSVVGVGSTFTVTLPLPVVAQAADAGGSAMIETPAAAQASLAGRQILVVDDTLDIRELLAATLSALGATVRMASDGDTAIQMATTLAYDVIFLDIQMPQMDGYEVTRRLRERGVETPIVAFTGRALVGEKETCLAAGCNDYYRKPIGVDLLRQVAVKWCVR